MKKIRHLRQDLSRLLFLLAALVALYAPGWAWNSAGFAYQNGGSGSWTSQKCNSANTYEINVQANTKLVLFGQDGDSDTSTRGTYTPDSDIDVVSGKEYKEGTDYSWDNNATGQAIGNFTGIHYFIIKKAGKYKVNVTVQNIPKAITITRQNPTKSDLYVWTNTSGSDTWSSTPLTNWDTEDGYYTGEVQLTNTGTNYLTFSSDALNTSNGWNNVWRIGNSNENIEKKTYDNIYKSNNGGIWIYTGKATIKFKADPNAMTLTITDIIDDSTPETFEYSYKLQTSTNRTNWTDVNGFTVNASANSFLRVLYTAKGNKGTNNEDAYGNNGNYTINSTSKNNSYDLTKDGTCFTIGTTGNYTFSVTEGENKVPTKLTVTAVPAETYTYKYSIIYGTSAGSLTSPQALTLSGSTATATVSFDQRSYFKIRREKLTSAGAVVESETTDFGSKTDNYKFSKTLTGGNNNVTGTNPYPFIIDESGTYKFTVSITNNEPTTVMTEYNKTKYFIIYGDNNSDSGLANEIELTENNGNYVGSLVVDSKNYYFKVKVVDSSNNATTYSGDFWFRKEGTEHYNAGPAPIDNSKNNLYLVNAGYGKWDFTVTVNGEVPQSVDAVWANVVSTAIMPAKEARVRIRTNLRGAATEKDREGNYTNWKDNRNTNWTPIKSISNGVYFYPIGYAHNEDNDVYFQVEIDGKMYAHSENKKINGEGKSNAVSFGNENTEKEFYMSVKDVSNVYIWIDTDKKQIWYTKNTEPKLFVYPNEVQASKKWSDWVNPAVYITAEYLNNNTFAPDWEMTRESDGVYTIKNVVLRNKGDVYAHVLRPCEASSGVNGLFGTYEESTVKLTLPSNITTAGNLGLAYDLELNIAENSFTATPIIQSKNNVEVQALPFLSFVGVAYKQLNAGTTPNYTYKTETYTPESSTQAVTTEVKSTDVGWQDSWVLYKGENPLRDVNGRYIYSTQWPPKSDIKFMADKDGETVGVATDGMLFEYDDEHGVLSKADWSESVLTDDLYSDIKTLNNFDYDQKRSIGTTYSESYKWLKDGTTYARYTVGNVWLLGATKLWTGWGGHSKNRDGGWGAEWLDNSNWGYGEKNGNREGEILTPGEAYTLTTSKGNFMFAQPTYFNTVELFLPMKKDGDNWIVNTGALNDAVMITTQTIGTAEINGKSKAGDKGQYRPFIDSSKMGSATFVKATVHRYDYSTYDAEDHTKWGAIEDKAGNFLSREFTVLSDINESKWKNSDGTWKTNVDWYEDAELNPGTYFYGMDVEYTLNGETRHVWVPSPWFAVVSTTIDVAARPMQLVSIVSEQEIKDIVGLDNNWNTIPNSGGVTQDNNNVPFIKAAFEKLTQAERDFLRYNANHNFTYRANKSADVYRIAPFATSNDGTPDASVGKYERLTTAERDILQKLMTTPEFTPFVRWTSSYWIGAFDAEDYESMMDEKIENNEISSYTHVDDLKVYVRKHTSDAWPTDETNLAKLQARGTDYLYGRVSYGNGSLAARQYDVRVVYSYTPVGQQGEEQDVQTVTVDKTTPMVTPTMPTAVIESYWYETPVDANDAEITGDGYLTLKVNSAIESRKTEIDADPEHKAIDLKVKKSDAANRNLECHVRFYRPNVAENILDGNADIYIDLAVSTSKSDGNDIVRTTQYRTFKNNNTGTNYADDNGPVIEIKIDNQSPLVATNPIFEIKDVRYVNEGEDDTEANKIDVTQFDGSAFGKAWPTEITCQSIAEKKDFTYEGSASQYIEVGNNYMYVNGECTNYVLTQFDMDKDPGDVVGGSGISGSNNPQDQDAGISETNMKPVFYHVESYIDPKILAKYNGNTANPEKKFDSYFSLDEVVVYDRSHETYGYHKNHWKDGNTPNLYWMFGSNLDDMWYENDLGCKGITIARDVPDAKEILKNMDVYITPIYFFVTYTNQTPQLSLVTKDGSTAQLINKGIHTSSDAPQHVVINNDYNGEGRQIVAVHGGSFVAHNVGNDGGIVTGIESVNVGENCEPVYYNLQGLRVNKPAHGVFIKVTGNKSEKVIL